MHFSKYISFWRWERLSSRDLYCRRKGDSRLESRSHNGKSISGGELARHFIQ
jgi:hypothetical protein